MWWIIWLILSIVLLVIELFLSEPLTIWFGLSAAFVWLIAMIVPQLPWFLEIILFVVFSVCAIILLPQKRINKFLLKIKRRDGQETDIEYVLKDSGVVQEEINNDLSLGLVKIKGVVWQARSLDDSVIEKGSIVGVESVVGNKLYVKKIREGDE